ncbi:hypothetical protein EH223_02185 [candidate division KSB1 bacterium]|nr:hypothetical protein [candidate division KSB1 bacterium]RQW06528.1 MAG: hypothetical protein EH223_02185 [candidate division KSB1 bacterium]
MCDKINHRGKTAVLLGLILLLNCRNERNRFQPLHYFPVKSNHSWTFNGEIHRMEILEMSQGVGDRPVTFAYYDSLSTLLWKENYTLLQDQLYLNSFEPAMRVLPSISFEPPLPFAPIADKVGQKMVLKSIETQTDSLVHTTEVQVEYLIEAIENIQTPAGAFLNCIKMKINIIYPPTSYRPFFIGEQYWWYAPQVGPVKYDLPSAKGELVSMNVNPANPLPME